MGDYTSLFYISLLFIMVPILSSIIIFIYDSIKETRRNKNQRRGKNYEGKEVITNGAVGNVKGEYKKDTILLQKNISEGGNTVTVTLLDKNQDTVGYIVPTESLKEVLK